MAQSEKNRLILKPGGQFKFKREIIFTADGSSTIYMPELNENYHSINGAIQESMHVFIQAGLEQINLPKVKIFEVGFGTGLNCLLTILNSIEIEIEYHAVEQFPVEKDLLKELNYSSIFEQKGVDSTIFEKIHTARWEEIENIKPGFSLKKMETDLENYSPKEKFHLIYFDAFAPEVQPELWTPPVFQKMYSILEYNGILVTYCAKGEVRRTMQHCGFTVERLPGPPGKREMLRGRKKIRK